MKKYEKNKRTISFLLVAFAITCLFSGPVLAVVDDIGTSINTTTTGWLTGDLGKWISTIMIVMGIVGLVFMQQMGFLVRGIFGAILLGGIVGLVSLSMKIGGQMFP